jgi:hypothetical protein
MSNPWLGLPIKAGKVLWVFGIFGFYIVGQSAVIAALVGQQPFYRAMFWGFATSAAFTAFIYYLLKLTDRWIDHQPQVRDAYRAASILRNMRLSGWDTVDNQLIVNIWYSRQPRNELLRRAKKEGLYAIVREAVRRGWIRADLPADPRQLYECNIDDAIVFFKHRRWLDLCSTLPGRTE